MQNGLKKEIQLQTQQMVLTWILGLGQSEQANYAVKSICFSRLEIIKKFCEEQMKINPSLKPQYSYAVERINKPKDIQLPTHKEIPPGSPIGCDWDE